ADRRLAAGQSSLLRRHTCGHRLALFVSATTTAQSATGRIAGADPGIAVAHPAALSVQQYEQYCQPDRYRPGDGRAGGGGPVRTVPRQPGRAGTDSADAGADPVPALPGDREAASR